MITELSIKNYRSIHQLKIKNLKKINLFTGKNNTGKTSILEALFILTSNRTQSAIYTVLKARNEILGTETSQEEWAHIFYNHNRDPYKSIIELSSNIKSIELTFVPYKQISDDEAQFIKRIPIPEEEFVLFDDYLVGLQISATDGKKSLFPTNKRKMFYISPVLVETDDSTPCRFIRTEMDVNLNSSLWDNISLIENKEQLIVSALQIIEPKIEKLAFKGDNRIRRAFVKLKDHSDPVPIGNMGDGVNRILTIILALVNCDNSVLLIDEFENGLHYSVQNKLWEIIFKVSQDLNIQIFITTHSNDCITAFNEVMSSDRTNSELGQYINLTKTNENIIQSVIDLPKLSFAIEHNIETR